MAVRLERGEGDVLELTVGNLDGEDGTFLFNLRQLENVKTAIDYWQYETSNLKGIESVIVEDGGVVTIKRVQGDRK